MSDGPDSEGVSHMSQEKSSEVDTYPPLIACSLKCGDQVFVWRAHRESSGESGSGDSNV